MHSLFGTKGPCTSRPKGRAKNGKPVDALKILRSCVQMRLWIMCGMPFEETKFRNWILITAKMSLLHQPEWAVSKSLNIFKWSLLPTLLFGKSKPCLNHKRIFQVGSDLATLVCGLIALLLPHQRRRELQSKQRCSCC